MPTPNDQATASRSATRPFRGPRPPRPARTDRRGPRAGDRLTVEPVPGHPANRRRVVDPDGTIRYIPPLVTDSVEGRSDRTALTLVEVERALPGGEVLLHLEDGSCYSQATGLAIPYGATRIVRL